MSCAHKVPLTDGEVHDLDAMAEAITDRTRLIFVCNPNNPTGTVVRRAELERFLDRVPSDVLVVLDEAYKEFIRDPEVPDGIETTGTAPMWRCCGPSPRRTAWRGCGSGSRWRMSRWRRRCGRRRSPSA
ncbi:Putative phenylalanine aminotransferase [Streptomyces californicus]